MAVTGHARTEPVRAYRRAGTLSHQGFVVVFAVPTRRATGSRAKRLTRIFSREFRSAGSRPTNCDSRRTMPSMGFENAETIVTRRSNPIVRRQREDIVPG